MVLLRKFAERMIQYTTGDILLSDAEALVNTVNCVGVMGRGIALRFKQAYPSNFKAYESACNKGDVQPGKMFVHETGQLTPRLIINFPTKRHWRGKSQMVDIEAGLTSLVQVINDFKITSIAIPPLGSGLGGLHWPDVRTRIESALETLVDVRIVVFEPAAIEQPVISRESTRSIPSLTPARASLVGLMARYLDGLLSTSISLLELHKLMYFMQAAGEPLRLRYAKGPYGPYSENLRHVLLTLEGYYVSGYGSEGDQPNMLLELVPGATHDATQLLDEHPQTKERFDRVAELISGFESPYGMELLATVHWLYAEEACTTVESVVQRIQSWNERKASLFNERHVRIATEVLTAQGWMNVQAEPIGA